MASSEQKRQKKLAKKRTKDQQKRREIARKRNEMKSLAGRLRAISKCPVAVSQIGEGAYEPAGMSSAFFGRKLPDGRIMLAIYLIDLGCLGVKDAYTRVVSKSEFDDMLTKANLSQSLFTVQPSTVLKLVEQAVDYARSIGFEPRGDYAKMRPIFGDVDPGDCTESFAFGDEEGKPVYIRGPHETIEQALMIQSILEARVSEGNFEHVVPLHSDGRDFPELLDRLGDDVIDGHLVDDDEFLEDAG